MFIWSLKIGLMKEKKFSNFSKIIVMIQKRKKLYYQFGFIHSIILKLLS